MAGSTAIIALQLLWEAGFWDAMLVAKFHPKSHNAPILRVKQALLHGLLGLEDEGTMML
jgi:hypothetical protein